MTTPFLLIPGRHLVNTRFQEEYLFRHVRPPCRHIVFAVTSCNQANSRYNPIPFHIRAIQLDRFARQLAPVLGVTYSIVGVPHHRPTPRFVELLLKEVAEQSGGEIDPTPENTTVLCSTPALVERYQALGFPILPAEARWEEDESGVRRCVLVETTPIDVVRRLGELGAAALEDEWVRTQLHPATFSVLRDFPNVLETVRRLYSEPLLGEEGSITETRDYDTYVRSMGSAIDLKYDDIRDFLRPGRIIDEGCADGGLLARIARDFPDSDLIGVDLSAEMLARAAERQRAGDFSGCFVYFRQCNLMKALPLRDPVDTVICNSTLHELFSYGDGEESIRHYLRLKHDQLRGEGRLVARDVVGPENRRRSVLLWCNPEDGTDQWEQCLQGEPDNRELEERLNCLSTRARFMRFQHDFFPRRPRPSPLWEEVATPLGPGFRLSLEDAMEFITKKDYTDNWRSEMLERFCFWEYAEWRRALEEAGFRVVEGSRAYANTWRVERRFQGKVALFDEEGQPLPWPVTNMVLVGQRL